MTYLPTVPVANVGSECPNEDMLFMFLEKLSNGHPLPPNVLSDVNPYIYAPSNLPDGIWFLISSNKHEPVEHGFWKVKGEACKVFSNSMISGWKTRLEYFQGQAPNQHRTDWVMLEYWITRNFLDETIKESSSLCRVFLGGEQGVDHPKQQNMTNSQNASGSSSTNKSTVEKDDKAQNLGVTGQPTNYIAEMGQESDYLSRGDYLELLDFVDPAASPCSSSDNSSCVTMSSDECFDSLALLKELDADINQLDANCKLSIASSFRPNEVVMAPASPGSIIGITPSEDDVALSVDKNSGIETQKEASTSQSAGREVVKAKKKKHKSKFMCFMPFYFLF